MTDEPDLAGREDPSAPTESEQLNSAESSAPFRPSDALSFALGTLSRIPVPSPRVVDSQVAGTGLILAPLVGLLLGLGSGVPLLLGGTDLAHRILTATLIVALCAWLTRGLHWDGLADFTDGLGSRRPAAGALAIMRSPEIGTFAVLVLLFTALTQVFALALLPNEGQALAGWVSAQVGARVALGVAAGSWIRPARTDGLGAAVIGSVTPGRAAVLVSLGIILGTVACWIGGLPAVLGVVGVAAAAAVALLVGRISQTRLGGSTGDVLGATVELSVTTVLLVVALRP